MLVEQGCTQYNMALIHYYMAFIHAIHPFTHDVVQTIQCMHCSMDFNSIEQGKVGINARCFLVMRRVCVPTGLLVSALPMSPIVVNPSSPAH
jgi:hypothetical protein